MIRIVTTRRKPKRKPSVAASVQPQPRVSRAPWTGYDKHDHPRDTPLPCCPSAKCRRARSCVDPHYNLYCQRTHLSQAEFVARETAAGRFKPHTPQPPPRHPLEWEFRLNDLARATEKRRLAHQAMQERWKSGEFDDRYGKYAPKGTIILPPKRQYADEKMLKV